VIFQQLGGEAERVGRSYGTVGPDFERQLVIVSDLPQTSRFHGVIALAHRGVDRIDGDEADAKILVEVLVGRDVATAALQAHFHIELAAFTDGRDVDVLVEDLDIRVGFNHAGRDHARLISAHINRFGRIAGKLERNLLEIQDDVGRVFDHTGNRLELVQHAFYFDGGYRCAFNRGQQNPAQRIAHGGSEAALKGLGPEHAVLVG
jgi:hypothetical protein